MQTFMTEAGEAMLRTRLEHLTTLLDAQDDPDHPRASEADSEEITALALDLLETVRDHTAITRMALRDRRDVVELLERRFLN